MFSPSFFCCKQKVFAEEFSTDHSSWNGGQSRVSYAYSKDFAHRALSINIIGSTRSFSNGLPNWGLLCELTRCSKWSPKIDVASNWYDQQLIIDDRADRRSAQSLYISGHATSTVTPLQRPGLESTPESAGQKIGRRFPVDSLLTQFARRWACIPRPLINCLATLKALQWRVYQFIKANLRLIFKPNLL